MINGIEDFKIPGNALNLKKISSFAISTINRLAERRYQFPFPETQDEPACRALEPLLE